MYLTSHCAELHCIRILQDIGRKCRQSLVERAICTYTSCQRELSASTVTGTIVFAERVPRFNLITKIRVSWLKDHYLDLGLSFLARKVNDEPTSIHTTELLIWVVVLRTFCFQTRKPYIRTEVFLDVFHSLCTNIGTVPHIRPRPLLPTCSVIIQ
jgi:hypothetical protein